jgi:hypothetical protein
MYQEELLIQLLQTPSWANRKFKEGYAVWIDFNADGDFDAGEQVMTIEQLQVLQLAEQFQFQHQQLLVRQE